MAQFVECQVDDRAVVSGDVVVRRERVRGSKELAQEGLTSATMQLAGHHGTASGSMYRLQVVTSSINTSCATPGGMRTARSVGTVHDPTSVSTCITPLAP